MPPFIRSIGFHMFQPSHGRWCFMKSTPWETPSWKLWSRSLPWPKYARPGGMAGWYIRCRSLPAILVISISSPPHHIHHHLVWFHQANFIVILLHLCLHGSSWNLVQCHNQAAGGFLTDFCVHPSQLPLAQCWGVDDSMDLWSWLCWDMNWKWPFLMGKSTISMGMNGKLWCYRSVNCIGFFTIEICRKRMRYAAITCHYPSSTGTLLVLLRQHQGIWWQQPCCHLVTQGAWKWSMVIYDDLL